MQSRLTTDAKALRIAAEARINERPRLPQPVTEEQWQQLAYESAIRQVEQEIQIEELKKALAESVAEHQRDAELFELAPVGYFNLASDGTIVNVNQWAATLLQCDREQLRGGSLESLVENSQRIPFRNFVQQALSEGARSKCELTLTLCNQTQLFVSAKARRSADGTECRVIIVDVTDRKQAEASLAKSERHLRAIFETEPECVKLLDAEGCILEMNCAGLRMLDAESLESIRNRCVYPLIHADQRAAFRDLTRRVFQGESGVLQFGATGLRGRNMWFETHAAPLRDDDGRITALLAVTRDMTEQKRMEAIVECRTSVLQCIASGAAMDTTLNMLLRKLEAFAPEMFASILLLDAAGRRLHHAASVRLPEAYCHALDGGEIGPQAGSCGTAAFTGQQVIVEDIASDPLWADYRDLALQYDLRSCWSTPIFDAQRRVLGTFAIYYTQPCKPTALHFQCIDMITDVAAIAITRQRNEQALASSERRYRRLLESEMVGVIIACTDGRISEANEFFLKMLGYSEADLQGSCLRWDQITPPEWAAADQRAVKQLQTDGFCTPFEKQYFRKDGSRVSVLVNAAVLTDTDGDCICLITDLTERERVNAALRRSEASLAAAQALAHLGSWEFDFAASSSYWSAEMFRLFYRDPAGGAPGFQEFLTLIHDDDCGCVQALKNSTGATPEPIALQYRTNPLLGPERHLSSTVYIICDSTGQAVRVVGTTLDVTDRRRAEEAILRYETIFQQAGWGMVIADPVSQIMTHVNPAFAEMHGYDVNEMIGMNLADTIAKPLKDDLSVHVRTVHEHGHYTYESQHVRKDGTVFPCLTDVTAYKDSDGRVLFRAATFEDITKRKQAEEHQLQSQKMEAVGQLAGGIAHDFNNLLTVIDGYTTLLQLDSCQTAVTREYLHEIQTASARAADFTRRLLAFGRRQIVSLEVVDVNLVIVETLKMLEPLISRRIERDIVLDKNLHRVRADRGQISQILLNLALNARDAMPNGGRLTIQTRNLALGESGCLDSTASFDGSTVMIVVSDTGRGMPVEVQRRAFDPFFTTKPVGKGTGLGLSTVHNIVTQAGGRIELSSEPGKGCTFQIYLPKASQIADNMPSKTAKSSVSGGSETILLVEDDNSLRRLTTTILSNFGYRVIESADAESAQSILRSAEGPIQLLLTDVVMPGMDGPHLAELVLNAKPDIRVLFMSGYISDNETRHRLLTDERFIGKPFSPVELARKVRDALDA